MEHESEQARQGSWDPAEHHHALKAREIHKDPVGHAAGMGGDSYLRTGGGGVGLRPGPALTDKGREAFANQARDFEPPSQGNMGALGNAVITELPRHTRSRLGQETAKTLGAEAAMLEHHYHRHHAARRVVEILDEHPELGELVDHLKHLGVLR